MSVCYYIYILLTAETLRVCVCMLLHILLTAETLRACVCMLLYIYDTYSGDFEGLCVEGSDLQVQGDVVDEFITYTTYSGDFEGLCLYVIIYIYY